MARDVYEVLGVPRDATPEEIEAAWRRAVRAAHPDHNPGDPTADERLREVLEAGARLREKRRAARADTPTAPSPAPPPTWTQLAWDGGAGATTRHRLWAGRVVILHRR